MEVRETCREMLRDEQGASAPEYSVMIALVILVVMGAVIFLGLTVFKLFDNFGSIIAPFFFGGGGS